MRKLRLGLEAPVARMGLEGAGTRAGLGTLVQVGGWGSEGQEPTGLGP